MKDHGLVSIITPTWNCARFIGRTIASAQAQTYPHWEMIVVDDCSSDDTRTIVEEIAAADPRVRYHRLDRNSGAAVARTRAMELARGDFMAFLDSDDIWMPEKLERQLGFMDATGAAFSATSYCQIDENDAELGRVISVPRKIGYNRLLLDCPVGNSTVMYDVRKMGKFRVPDIRKRNDDALWLTMLKKEPYIYGFGETLMKYRVRSNSISSNKLQLIRYHWKLYRDIEHLSVPRSLFHIGVWCFIKVFRIK